MNKKQSLYKLSFLVCLLGLICSSCDSEPKQNHTTNNLVTAKASAQNEPNWQQEVDELNEKITILRRWQNGYRMTAEQAQFKADRLQFEQDNLMDAKRLWKIADNAHQKAEDLQVIIDKLEDQRNAILKKHNQPIPKNDD